MLVRQRAARSLPGGKLASLRVCRELCAGSKSVGSRRLPLDLVLADRWTSVRQSWAARCSFREGLALSRRGANGLCARPVEGGNCSGRTWSPERSALVVGGFGQAGARSGRGLLLPVGCRTEHLAHRSSQATVSVVDLLRVVGSFGVPEPLTDRPPSVIHRAPSGAHRVVAERSAPGNRRVSGRGGSREVLPSRGSFLIGPRVREGSGGSEASLSRRRARPRKGGTPFGVTHSRAEPGACMGPSGPLGAR